MRAPSPLCIGPWPRHRMMITWLALFCLLPLAPSVEAAEIRTGATGPALSQDPALVALVKEAMERRPELVQARAQIHAEGERIPQSRALPDPTLSLGIQNDGFTGIQIGKMETSFLAVTASQTFPWTGKRELRAETANLGARAAEADLRRTLLTITADTERAYLDLLLVRDQLSLLAKRETLWSQSEGLARARYQAGEGPQSDYLRAQLERQRLRQQSWALEAEERRRIAVLNRLRGHPLGEPIATERTLADLPDPLEPDPNQAMVDAETDSPELKKALLAGEQAGRRVELAKKERWPDVTVVAGIMPRWGNYATMWQAGVALNLPVWTAQKQSRSIAENQARGIAALSGAEAIRQVLRQRISERLTALHALVAANRLYRSELLVQSEATAASTMVQYQVGRVTFASVLEALAGYLADRNAFLVSVADAQRIAIAQREISLDALGATSGAAMGGSPIPGSGDASAASSPSGPASGQLEGVEGGSAMSRR